jgi:hypothetical protein
VRRGRPPAGVMPAGEFSLSYCGRHLIPQPRRKAASVRRAPASSARPWAPRSAIRFPPLRSPGSSPPHEATEGRCATRSPPEGGPQCDGAATGGVSSTCDPSGFFCLGHRPEAICLQKPTVPPSWSDPAGRYREQYRLWAPRRRSPVRANHYASILAAGSPEVPA